jgi:hypothetical protein
MRSADACSARAAVSPRHLPISTLAGLVAALTVAASAGPLMADQSDDRWQPWLGCWELMSQAADEPKVLPIRTCVMRPANDAGVRITTTVAGGPPVEEQFVADGTERPIEDGPCRGMRRAEWSRNGRLFSRARIECSGSAPYAVSHLATIAGDTWIDIQGITRGADEAVRVRHYQRVREGGLPADATPPDGSSQFSIEEVKEASRLVTPLVLEAALVETRARFALNGRTMLDLDRSGVPDEITDVMVALSYPDRFRVRPRTPDGSGAGPVRLAECGIYDTCVYGWDPFGYTDWRVDDYWYAGDVVVIGPPDGGGRPPEERGGGRVVNHRGYTRIEPAPAPHSGSGAASTSSTDSSSGDSGGTSSSGVSPQGYSSGSSGGDSGRTAQPRPPE